MQEREKNPASLSQAKHMATGSFDQAAPPKYFNQYYSCTVNQVLRQHGNRHQQKIQINNPSNLFIIQDSDHTWTRQVSTFRLF